MTTPHFGHRLGGVLRPMSRKLTVGHGRLQALQIVTLAASLTRDCEAWLD